MRIRDLVSCIATAVAVIGVAGTAGATPTISAEWASNNSNVLSVTSGAASTNLVLNLYLDLTAEAQGALGFGFSVNYDDLGQNSLDVVTVTELGVPPWALHITPGNGPPTGSIEPNPDTSVPGSGQVQAIEASNFVGGSGGGLRTLVGTITFHVNSGATDTNATPVLRLGEGVTDPITFAAYPTVNLIGATLNVSSVPEPASAALLGLGLLGLAVTGRRRNTA